MTHNINIGGRRYRGEKRERVVGGVDGRTKGQVREWWEEEESKGGAGWVANEDSNAGDM